MRDEPREGREGEREPRAVHEPFEEDVDEASEASFPASDPPAWMALRPGGPARRPEARAPDRSPPSDADDRASS